MSKKPNILLLTSDQHRGDALGSAGHSCVRTPHLDKLAAMGTRFDRAYVDCPVCIPQRTTWITGIQSHLYGMPSFNPDYRVQRERGQFLGSLITQAGYQTHLVGKTHWHTEPSFRAGFESVVSFKRLGQEIERCTRRSGAAHTGIGANELNPTLNHLPPELYSTDWAIDRSMEFLEYRDRTQPFFLWVSLTDPHPPNTIHEPYYSMYEDDDILEANVPAWSRGSDCPMALIAHRDASNWPRMKPTELRKARGVYYGKITNLDHQLGRVLGRLQIEGSLDDTFIVYTSDHGEMLGDYDDTAKSTFLEPSVNVPLIVRPQAAMGFEPGRVLNALVGLDDLLPTLCEVAGAACPEDVTGRSWVPLLTGENPIVRDHLHGQIDNSHMFHDGEYKYLYFADDGTELLFHADDRLDAQNMVAESGPLERMRRRFTEHLASENHPHLVDGRLVNLNTPWLSEAQLRARNALGWPSPFRGNPT